MTNCTPTPKTMARPHHRHIVLYFSRSDMVFYMNWTLWRNYNVLHASRNCTWRAVCSPWRTLWCVALNLQHFTNHVHFSKCDRTHPSDSSCSLHTVVCRLLQPAYERHAVCCSMLHPAYWHNAGCITPLWSLHTSLWRLRTFVLQPSCRDACYLHAACMHP